MAMPCLPLVITALVTFGAVHNLFGMAIVAWMPGMIALMGIHAETSAFTQVSTGVMHSLYGIGNLCNCAGEET